MGRRRGGVLEAALCGLLVGWLGVGRAWAQASGQPASRDVEEGLRALAAGQQAYDGLDMEQALAHLQRALSQPELARQPALRSRAWTLKVAAQLAQGDAAGALQEAQRLLAVDADAHFSPDHFPPEALAQLERLRLRVRSGEARTAPQAQLLVQRALHLPAAPSAAGLLAQAPRTPASAAGRGAQRAGYGLLG
ncbi:MAG TPA: hypothetical protein VFO83_13255, partial [Aggregicoccus sp.]|nr:hypothetical protein [Aggregicoccus sp.]